MLSIEKLKYSLPQGKYRRNRVLKAQESQFDENYISMKMIIGILYIYDAQTFAKNLFV